MTGMLWWVEDSKWNILELGLYYAVIREPLKFIEERVI